ncbi:hypothetical protein D3C73_1061300 [compost metagenome]
MRGWGQDAVQDRLAVLGFTDLQIGRFRRGSDGVAQRVDHVQARLFAGNLPAEDQRRLGVHPVMAVFGVLVLHLAVHQQGADVGRSLEQVGHVAQVRRAPLVCIALQPRHQQLRRGQVAGGHHHVGGLAGVFEHVQFAVHADIVQRGIGAGVGGEDQALVHLDSNAIGHVGALSYASRIVGRPL